MTRPIVPCGPECGPIVGRGMCNRHYQAAWKRGDLENLPRGTSRNIARVCPPDHNHDEASTCYNLHKCRCEPCYLRRSTSNKRRLRDGAYGRWVNPYVPAEPVRQHVLELQASGIGYKRIAALAGVGVTGVAQLLWGRKGATGDPRKGEVIKRVSRVNAEKLLAVVPSTEILGQHALLDSRGARRRIQALVARGWSQSRLAPMLGMTAGNLSTLLLRDKITREKSDEFAALFDRLWDTTPNLATSQQKAGARRSMNRARLAGWPPPLAWDDIDTDDVPASTDTPESDVDEMAVELAMAGEPVRLTPIERRTAVTRLHAERWSDQRIAETLRIADRTVLRIRQELGLVAFDFSDLRQRGAA